MGTDMSEQIVNFIVQELEKSGPLPVEDVLSFNFIDSGFIDSLSIMKFLVALEAKFTIQFTDDELLSEEFKTIGSLSLIISQKTEERSNA